MDKKKSPRGQVIETLDDFKYYLGYMTKGAGSLGAYTKNHVLQLVKEAESLESYDDGKVSYFVDKIDGLYDGKMDSKLEMFSSSMNMFFAASLDFRCECEDSFGEDNAFTKVCEKYKDYLEQYLEKINDADAVKQGLKSELSKANKFYLEGSSERIKRAWTSLYRFNVGMQKSSEYFEIEIRIANNRNKRAPSKYKPYEPYIITVLKEFEETPKGEKFTQLKAIDKINNMLENEGEGDIESGTFNRWLKNYRGNNGLSIFTIVVKSGS